MKKKVLIVQNYIAHYRVDFFKALSRKYRTDLYTSNKVDIKYNNLSISFFNKISFFGFFFYSHLTNLIKQNKYDVLILEANPRIITLFYIYFIFHRRIKIIFWGAQQLRNPLLNFIWTLFLKKSSALFVFYSKSKYEPFSNYDSSRFHLVNNTIHVKNRIKAFNERRKLFFINVGSFHARKQNDVLLFVFKQLITKKNAKLKLYLIGSGEEKPRLEEIISSLGLKKNAFIIDETTDSDLLKFYYQHSIAAVSFGQAGLAVQQSMAFGVPFITKINAISGGEKDNIIHAHNGLICEDTEESLYETLSLLVDDVTYSRYLGMNAYIYYSKYCSMNNMISKFSKLIEN
jgi:glycosyltransferase involved in cell wall biosynthesis